MTTITENRIKEAYRFANRVRKALGQPIRRTRAAGTRDRCPLEAAIDIYGVSLTARRLFVTGTPAERERRRSRLREAGLEELTDEGDPLIPRGFAVPPAVRDFTMAADAGQLPSEIQGWWAG